MYESFYGLREKPFNLLPDPSYLYMSQSHTNAYFHLDYAISEQKGFVVITGEVGSGKTTLINYLLQKIQQDIYVGLINNTYVPPAQFIKLICQEFELDTQGFDEAELTDRFRQFLLEQYANKIRVVLIIDEAQNLAPQTLEKLRLLSNLEDMKHHLVQMILVGQPELKLRLQRNDLEQFAQRVTVHCHLGGLKRDEVEKYILFRLKVAGAKNPDIFDKDAIEAISQYSRNIPRIINNLCDTALVYGYADGLQIIDKKTIDNVVSERQVGGILSINSQDEMQTIPAFLGDGIVEDALENRFQSIERRLAVLEDIIEFGKKLDSIAENKNRQDALSVELIKLLKSNIESRLSLQLELMLTKKDTENDNTKEQSNVNHKKSYKEKNEPIISLEDRLLN